MFFNLRWVCGVGAILNVFIQIYSDQNQLALQSGFGCAYVKDLISIQ